MSIEGSRRNYSWAAFLIILGVVLLLNTTNIVGWGIWIYAGRYWPVLVVLLGFRIILGNSLVARIFQMIFTIALTVGVFLVSYIQFTAEPLDFLPESVNSWIVEGGSGILNLEVESVEGNYTISTEDFEKIEEISLDMDLGAGVFSLMEEDIEDLIYVNAKFPKNGQEPSLEAIQSDGTVDITFTSATSKGFFLFSNESSYDILLDTTEYPYDINLNLGAGDGNVILKHNKIKNLYGEVGAGKIDFELGVDSTPTGDVRFSVGAGKLKLVLPQRIGYQVEYDLGVGTIRIDDQDLAGVSGGRGKYKSTNYGETDIQLNMYVTVGVGTFEIERE